MDHLEECNSFPRETLTSMPSSQLQIDKSGLIPSSCLTFCASPVQISNLSLQLFST